MITLNVNGKPRNLDIPDDMPLLWTLRDVLEHDRHQVRLRHGAVRRMHDPDRRTGRRAPVSRRFPPRPASSITTIEAIGATPAGKKIQRAWLALDVPQCGYCQSGQIMSASALLASKPKPERLGHRRCDGGQHLPLRHLSADSRCDQTSGGRHGRSPERSRPEA